MTYSYIDTIVNSLNCEEFLIEYITQNFCLSKLLYLEEGDRYLEYLAINKYYTLYFTQFYHNYDGEEEFLKNNKLIANCSYETLVNNIEDMLDITFSFEFRDREYLEFGSIAGNNIDWDKLLVDYCDDGFEPNLENPNLLRDSLVQFIGLKIVRKSRRQLAENIGESINSSIKKIQKIFRKRRETRLATLVTNRRCRELNISNFILPLVLEWV